MLKAAGNGESARALHHDVWQDGGEGNPGLEDHSLISDIVSAVRGLEYGAVTVSVQGGRVVQLERSEKRRLSKGT